MGEYTLMTLVAMAAVVALEFAWLRTGVFARAQYWCSMAIVVFFQCLVDGWLTKLRDPVVVYADPQFSRVRFPWDIPVEDFGFGFAMVTLTIMMWLALGRRSKQAESQQAERGSGEPVGRV